jgi:hypothetical protein
VGSRRPVRGSGAEPGHYLLHPDVGGGGCDGGRGIISRYCRARIGEDNTETKNDFQVSVMSKWMESTRGKDKLTGKDTGFH